MKAKILDNGDVEVVMSEQDADVITGVLSMIASTPDPEWWTSTGEEETAITPEMFDKTQAAWISSVIQSYIDRK